MIPVPEYKLQQAPPELLRSRIAMLQECIGDNDAENAEMRAEIEKIEAILASRK